MQHAARNKNFTETKFDKFYIGITMELLDIIQLSATLNPMKDACKLAPKSHWRSTLQKTNNNNLIFIGNYRI